MITTLCKSALILGVIMFSASHAFAHAELVKATPTANSTVSASPVEIALTFSEAVDLKFSGAKLTDSMKMDIATGPASLAKGDDTTLVIPVTKPLAAGEYVVAWHNLSRDGHKSKGSFNFTVKP